MNIQLDRIQQHVIERLRAGDQTLDFAGLADGQQSPSHQIADLWHAIQSLSITSKTQALLPPDKVVDLISGVSRFLPQQHENSSDVFVAHKSDLIWLVTAKAAVQTLGLVLGSLVKQTHVLNDEVLYWDDILASYWYIGFHTIQTAPTRLWHGAKNICFYKANQDTQDQHRGFLSSRWTQFYDSVRRSIYAQPVYTVPARISSHFAIHRSDIRRKQQYLKMTKDLHSSGIGILMGECLSFNIDDLSTPGSGKALEDRWRNTVSRIVVLMEDILYNSVDESAVADFEHKIFTTAHAEEFSIQNQLYDGAIPGNPAILIGRLVHILKDRFPKYAASSNELVQKYGRPSCLVRYWLPFSLLFFSAYTSLRILTNRRTEIIRWVVNIGSTAVDFWSNWVLDPIQRLIGTIRHDKESEIAIMSKNSLMADRASLERMVVDFIQDKNDLSATDTHTIMNSVKEGDLTPVLKAYERDLRSPFVGTIRGDLVRTLLIQIQKTKVDVEVAISGIDSLLKSQELVFGYVLPLVQSRITY